MRRAWRSRVWRWAAEAAARGPSSAWATRANGRLRIHPQRREHGAVEPCWTADLGIGLPGSRIEVPRSHPTSAGMLDLFSNPVLVAAWAALFGGLLGLAP